MFLRGPTFISIAEVHGHAVGAGFRPALAGNMRVVADDAVFCVKEPTIGLARPHRTQAGGETTRIFSGAGSLCSRSQENVQEAATFGPCTQRLAHR